MTRIACLTPLPPERTGIADYSSWLLKELAQHVEVHAFAPGRPHPIDGVRIVRPTPRALRKLGQYDAVMAQVGNSPAHAWILDALPHCRATVVLHELVLHHLVAHMTLGRGDVDGYLAAMTREAGAVGRLLAHAVVDKIAPPLWDVAADRYPMTDSALRAARHVIVHSGFMSERIRQHWPDLPVTVIPHLCPRLAENPESRERPGAGPVFGVFGFVTRQKRLPVVMAAFAHVRRELPSARLLVVGSAPDEFDPRRLAATEGVPDEAVDVVGFAHGEEFDRLLASVDVGVGLRHPTLGETSGPVVRWLGLGIPVIVSTGGWYDELPDAAVRRIEPGRGEVTSLAGAMLLLAGDEEARGRMGAAARNYARDSLAVQVVADAYLRALLGPSGRRPIAEALLADVAGRLAEIAPEPARDATGLLRHLATAMRDTGVM